jgi:hypothetical protein
MSNNGRYGQDGTEFSQRANSLDIEVRQEGMYFGTEDPWAWVPPQGGLPW